MCIPNLGDDSETHINCQDSNDTSHHGEFPSVPGSAVYFPVISQKIPDSAVTGICRQPVDSAARF
jgi:hypothetical protein